MNLMPLEETRNWPPTQTKDRTGLIPLNKSNVGPNKRTKWVQCPRHSCRLRPHFGLNCN